MKLLCVHRRGTAIVVGVALSALLCVPAQAQQSNAGPSNSAFTDLSQYLFVGDQAVPRQTITAPAAATLSSTVTQTGQGNVASATPSSRTAPAIHRRWP
jgi:hypothetical protein